MKNHKEKYKVGAMFTSEKYPWADIVIDSVIYARFAQNAKDFNVFSFIGWQRINRQAFDKFVCEQKGYEYKLDKEGCMNFTSSTTFPYAYFGERSPASMDSYLQRYDLKFAGMKNEKIVVYRDDDIEYNATLKN